MDRLTHRGMGRQGRLGHRNLAAMVEELQKLVADAEARLGDASTLEAVKDVDAEFLGKKSALTAAKKQLGELDPDERRRVGLAVNEIRQRIESLVEASRRQLMAEARATRYEAERLDLTETRDRVRRGHSHLVTQSRDRLEDVFVGMGFTVAEGPEVETAWYNFEALNIPEWHPARGGFDTIFVNLGEPEEVMLRSHTSPVQIRTMEVQEPPIYIVAPGRTFRTDTADDTTCRLSTRSKVS